ncbi:isoprenylcysteine carboxylmethyltransferase family protein, partial [Methanosarcina sp. Z-7115]|nr:isoprenylcysteine carboxylmethyltransferase family protein [Methanosarcina sp. Z-7115]
MEKNPKLLERRVKAGPEAEKEKTQKIIQLFAAICFFAIIALPALDHRFGWSNVPLFIVIVGDILVSVGFFSFFSF